MKAIFQISTFFILFTFGYLLVYCCSCIDPSQRQRFRAADVVFVGKVVEFNLLTDAEYDELNKVETNKELVDILYRVTFKVEKQWKGKKQTEITALASFDNPGMCNDLDLSVGKRILVYAPREHGHLLIYRDCGPNRNADYAKDEIKRLSNFFFRTYTFFYPYPKF